MSTPENNEPRHLESPFGFRGILGDEGCLLAILRFYQHTHKPEYALKPCAENQIFPLKAGLQQPREELLKGEAWAHYEAGNFAERKTESAELLLLKELVSQYTVIGTDPFNVLSYRPDEDRDAEIRRRFSYFVEWAETELSPEYWQDSCLPDLLCIRAFPGVAVGSKDDPCFLADRENWPRKRGKILAPRLVDDRGYLGLLPSRYFLLDWNSHPPGHPIPAAVLEEAAKALKNEAKGGAVDGDV